MSGVTEEGAYYGLNAGDKIDLFRVYKTVNVRSGTVAYFQKDRDGETNAGVVEAGHFGKLVDTPVRVVALESTNFSVEGENS